MTFFNHIGKDLSLEWMILVVLSTEIDGFNHGAFIVIPNNIDRKHLR